MICLSDMDFVIHYVTMSMYNYDLTTCKPSVETVLFLEDYDFKDKVKKVYSKIDQRFNHIFFFYFFTCIWFYGLPLILTIITGRSQNN